jgi:hypothetical protein
MVVFIAAMKYPFTVGRVSRVISEDCFRLRKILSNNRSSSVNSPFVVALT